jgi:hypothetical protein
MISIIPITILTLLFANEQLIQGLAHSNSNFGRSILRYNAGSARCIPMPEVTLDFEHLCVAPPGAQLTLEASLPACPAPEARQFGFRCRGAWGVGF